MLTESCADDLNIVLPGIGVEADLVATHTGRDLSVNLFEEGHVVANRHHNQISIFFLRPGT